MATHSGILAGKIPWTEESGELQSVRMARVRCALATKQPQQSSLLLRKVDVIVCILQINKGAKRGICQDAKIISYK